MERCNGIIVTRVWLVLWRAIGGEVRILKEHIVWGGGVGGGRVRMSFQSRPSEESGSLTTFPKSERQCSVVVIMGGKGKGKGKANWFAL